MSSKRCPHSGTVPEPVPRRPVGYYNDGGFHHCECGAIIGWVNGVVDEHDDQSVKWGESHVTHLAERMGLDFVLDLLGGQRLDDTTWSFPQSSEAES